MESQISFGTIRQVFVLSLRQFNPLRITYCSVYDGICGDAGSWMEKSGQLPWQAWGISDSRLSNIPSTRKAAAYRSGSKSVCGTMVETREGTDIQLERLGVRLSRLMNLAFSLHDGIELRMKI